MIKDAAVRAEVLQEWASIIALTKATKTVRLRWGDGQVAAPPPDTFYNLPLILAYSTLDGVLGQFINEGVFPCICGKKKTCFNLGDKMKSAKKAIPWHDFALVDKGKKARNDVAHDNKLWDKDTCLKFVHAVGAELRGWGLIP